MEWVQGDPLAAYVERNLSSPGVLRDLAEQLVGVCTELRRSGIAHGDLQHGNILVRGGQLVLIDYDGMFVPDLTGKMSVELGHRNYQHPRRSAAQFGPYLDNFSAWVIYASLLALSVAPSLWEQTNAGDDYLLFAADDFATPEASATLRHLSRLPDSTIRSVVSVLRNLTEQDLEQIPPLDQSLLPALPLIGPVTGTVITANKLSWLEDHIVSEPASPTVTIPTVVEVPEATWVQDHVAPKRTLAEFRGPIRLERTLAGSIVAGSAMLVILLIAGLVGSSVWIAAGVVAALVMVMSCVLAWCYLNRAEVQEAYQARKSLRVLERRAVEIHWQIDRSQNSLLQIQKDAFAAIHRELQTLQREHVTKVLRSHSLQSAKIHGIGPSLKANLQAAGIHTAYDVNHARVTHVYGIGSVKAASIVTWRQMIERQAQSSIPSSLPSAVEARVTKEYEDRRQIVEKEKDRLSIELLEVETKISAVAIEVDGYQRINLQGFVRRLVTG